MRCSLTPVRKFVNAHFDTIHLHINRSTIAKLIIFRWIDSKIIGFVLLNKMRLIPQMWEPWNFYERNRLYFISRYIIFLLRQPPKISGYHLDRIISTLYLNSFIHRRNQNAKSCVRLNFHNFAGEANSRRRSFAGKSNHSRRAKFIIKSSQRGEKERSSFTKCTKKKKIKKRKKKNVNTVFIGDAIDIRYEKRAKRSHIMSFSNSTFLWSENLEFWWMAGPCDEFEMWTIFK